MHLKAVLVYFGHKFSRLLLVIRMTFINLLLDHSTPWDGAVLQKLIGLSDSWNMNYGRFNRRNVAFYIWLRPFSMRLAIEGSFRNSVSQSLMARRALLRLLNWVPFARVGVILIASICALLFDDLLLEHSAFVKFNWWNLTFVVGVRSLTFINAVVSVSFLQMWNVFINRVHISLMFDYDFTILKLLQV